MNNKKFYGNMKEIFGILSYYTVCRKENKWVDLRQKAMDLSCHMTEDTLFDAMGLMEKCV